MMSYDLRPLIRWILTEYEPAMRRFAGHYVRTLGDTRYELYGTSDMACVLHTIGALRPDATERAQWAEAFAAMVDPSSGQLVEHRPTHGRLHNTAFALAAMQLLGLTADHAMPFFEPLRAPEQAAAFLETLDWKTRVYSGSHDGAGLASIVALVPSLYDPRWFSAYFDRLDRFIDPRNGMMGVDKPAGGDSDQIGGSFHYAFLYEFFHRPMPHAAARIDAVLGLQKADGFWHPTNHYWMTLDAIYLLTRSHRRGAHRGEDIRTSVLRALEALYPRLLDPASRDAICFGVRDGRGEPLGVHQLTAVLSLFAEAQNFLGSEAVLSEYPLRLVLDARPFI